MCFSRIVPSETTQLFKPVCCSAKLACFCPSPGKFWIWIRTSRDFLPECPSQELWGTDKRHPDFLGSCSETHWAQTSFPYTYTPHTNADRGGGGCLMIAALVHKAKAASRANEILPSLRKGEKASLNHEKKAPFRHTSRMPHTARING